MKVNKSALIVGGSSGIGEEFAKYFLSNGLDVAIVSRSSKKLGDARKYLEKFNSYNRKIETLNGDVTDESFYTALEEVFNLLGAVPDYIVYTAGIALPGKLAELSLDKFTKSMDTNYFGFVKLAKFLSLQKIEKKIKFIAISSMAALIDTFGYTTYAPTKIAMRSFAKGLSFEQKNISFYIVYPIDTLTNQLMEENSTKPLETFLVDESGGLTTPDKVVSYTMKVVEKTGKKNFYEVMPEGKLVYFISKIFPWIIDIAVNSAIKKADKIRKSGREKEVIDEINKKYKEKFEKFEREKR